MNMKITLVLSVFIAVSACSESTKVSDDLPASQANDANPTGREAQSTSVAGERPVRIGEGGPRFDACQAVGRVTRSTLDVRGAPFDSAAVKDTVSAGQQVYICTRSLDQGWFGVVYDEARPAAISEDGEDATPPGTPDCGVSSPVRSKRNYDGPCKSGWLESNFVKLIAG